MAGKLEYLVGDLARAVLARLTAEYRDLASRKWDFSGERSVGKCEYTAVAGGKAGRLDTDRPRFCHLNSLRERVHRSRGLPSRRPDLAGRIRVVLAAVPRSPARPRPTIYLPPICRHFVQRGRLRAVER